VKKRKSFIKHKDTAYAANLWTSHQLTTKRTDSYLRLVLGGCYKEIVRLDLPGCWVHHWVSARHMTASDNNLCIQCNGHDECSDHVTILTTCKLAGGLKWRYHHSSHKLTYSMFWAPLVQMGDCLLVGIPPCMKPTQLDQVHFACLHLSPESLNHAPALIGWGNGTNVTAAGWQVTLCNPYST